MSAELLLWWAEDAAGERARRSALLEALGEAEPSAGWAARARRRAWGEERPSEAPPTVRGAVVADSPTDAAARIRGSAESRDGPSPVGSGLSRPVAWLLPGHGSEHRGMAAALYGASGVFTEACDSLLDDLGRIGERARRWWVADSDTATGTIETIQPTLLAVEWGLTALLRSWGVVPAVLLGHSVGESMAGRIAGVLGRADFARLTADRLSRAGQVGPGGMVAVAASARRVLYTLVATRARDRGVVIGAVNGARQVLVCGPAEPLADVVGHLRDEGLTCSDTGVRMGFHSPAVEAICSAGEETWASVELHPPAVPIRSGYRSGLLDADSARSSRFWSRQPAQPVRFHSALQGLLAEGPHLLVEAGPGAWLTGVARRHRSVITGASRAVAMLPSGPSTHEVARRQLLEAAAALWSEGAAHDVGGLENSLKTCT